MRNSKETKNFCRRGNTFLKKNCKQKRSGEYFNNNLKSPLVKTCNKWVQKQDKPLKNSLEVQKVIFL